MKFKYATGATPLDLDEATGLIPTHITTHEQLNAWEHQNILKAEDWLLGQFHKNLLTIDFLKNLHKKMFDDSWKWAGTFRMSEKNIGIIPALIITKLKELLDDISFQFEHSTYQMDEIAYRFHHRLVAIHPFPNGNGRHARMMADALLLQNNQSRFTWGSSNLTSENVTRKKYIAALKKADRYDYHELANFVRS